MAELPYLTQGITNWEIGLKPKRFPLISPEFTHFAAVSNVPVWIAVGDENVVVDPGKNGTFYQPANEWLVGPVSTKSFWPDGEEPPPPEFVPTHLSIVAVHKPRSVYKPKNGPEMFYHIRGMTAPADPHYVLIGIHDLLAAQLASVTGEAKRSHYKVFNTSRSSAKTK